MTTKNNFNSLSIRDLIEARDLFHVHLIKKENVVATAIGRYRIRKKDKKPGQLPGKTKILGKRTLGNSEIRDYSWPCILVFVSEWKEADELYKKNYQDLIPNCVYMPDGRVVPICVVEAPRVEKSDDFVDIDTLNFPRNLLSGGLPLIVELQGQEHVASIGCLVTDGNKTFAMTNRHVTGETGTIVYSKLGANLQRIGVSSEKQIGKRKFTEVYEGWQGENLLVNMDAGLIEVDDVNMWKTEVFGIGQFDTLVNLSTTNISLDLIGEKVLGYGARSGKIEGEITALFYRYKSIGGTEYLSDFLIGPVEGDNLNIGHGDSGTLLLLKDESRLRPFALLWGLHEFGGDSNTQKNGYALASGLINICKFLDVDLVREWNLDLDYTWGKTGHYKIAARACDLVSDPALYKLLQANKWNIGYSDSDLEEKDPIAKAKSEEFIPLADVADLYFRTKRFSTEGSNHFADMDETHEEVYNGKSLLDLCKNDKNIDVEVWKDFYALADKVDPKTKKDYDGKIKPAPRLGALPFRIWQIYNQMVKSLKAGKVDEFICAGGILTHYLGDTTIPLHVSYLHSGIPGHETKVHGDYENGMLDGNMSDAFAAINKVNKKVVKSDLITGGKEVGKLAVKIMRATLTTLPPMTIIKCFDKLSGRGKYQQAWKTLGKATSKNLSDGCYWMAVLWQSAWIEGNGNKIKSKGLKEIDKQTLMDLYKDYHFVQSYILTDAKFKNDLY